MAGQEPQFTYGGQAVIEGVMMRGRKFMAVAVRAPDGEIVVRSEALPARLYSGLIARTPFVRGITILWDTLGLGMKALMFSADVAMQENRADGSKAEMPRAVAWTSVAIALVIGVGVFFVTPNLLAGVLESWLESPVLVNFVEGLVRLSFLVAYVGLIGLLPDIRRVYMYHGAEHMTIHAFEHGDELEPHLIARHPPEHPRCGTAFLLIVITLSILLFALFGWPDLWLRIGSRVLLIPVLAGLAYELLKFGARHERNPLMRALVWPGLLLQELTTRQPTSDQIEVAVAAFRELRRVEAEASPAAA